MTEQEYIATTKKVTGTRKHTITNSIGVNNFINAYTKTNKEFSAQQIRAILKRINQLCAEKIAQGKYVKFPNQMGGLEIREFNTYVKFKDGKLRTNRPIDWNATMLLWYNDEQAKATKRLVRTEDKKIFKVFYNKGYAKYNNKVFVTFIPSRTLKNLIKQNIREGIIKDAFMIHG